jgi:hypothetical protein
VLSQIEQRCERPVSTQARDMFYCHSLSRCLAEWYFGGIPEGQTLLSNAQV